jgi:hypothetical protein
LIHSAAGHTGKGIGHVTQQTLPRGHAKFTFAQSRIFGAPVPASDARDAMMQM